MHNSLVRPSLRAFAAFLMTLLFAALSACGGSGAGAGGSNSVADTQAQSLTLLSNVTALESDGTATATITAIVKDGGNRAIANQDVVFTTTDPGATLLVVSARTDASGKATAKLSTTDPQARTITVRATVAGGSGQITATHDVQVAGTSVSISGPPTIAFGGSSTFNVSVRDSGSNPIGGASVTLASSNGNAISTPTVLTNSLGQASFTVNGTVAGNDSITATALSVTSAPINVSVSGTQLEFVNPASAAELGVNQSHEIRVRLRVNGAAVSGQSISFSATRGALAPATATTDASGEAAVQISSPTAGFASITATEGGGATISQAVEFVATTASKIALQASPTVVGVNLSASGTNSAQLIAVVRDAADNPVKNQRVNFSSVSDPSNGRIEPGFAITDSSGTATSSFIPGANTTGPDGVVLKAMIQGTAISANASLTASRQELSVIIGTGNTIEEPDTTTYRMPWTALVTDSSGNPVVNANVTVQLEPLGFRTGRWVVGAGAGASWTQTINAECASEDTNRNGRLDAGEDLTTGDVGTIGRLDPGQVAAATVTSTGGVTDDFGEAKIVVNYPQEYGSWVRYRIRVTISAPAGTEGVAVTEFWLPVLASDIQSTDTLPPGATSPIGPFKEGTACTPL